MKRFDYWCNYCKHKFEEMITTDTVVRCHKCTSRNVKRLISAPTYLTNKISDSKLREQFSEQF